MADNTVVTELIVDASGAKSGSDQYAASMAKIDSASNQTINTTNKVQDAISRQTVTMTGSVGRQAAQFPKLAAAVDPVTAAQLKLTQATTAGTAALVAGKATQDEVNNVVSIYEARLAAAKATTLETAAAMEVAGGAAVAMAAEQEDAALASAAVTRELIVLGREGLVGNFSRLPGSILALSERIQSTGAGVLNLATIFKLFGSVASAIFNPIVLSIVGLSVAMEVLPRIFSSIGASGQVLKDHEALIERITKAYGDAAKSAINYGVVAKNALADLRDAQKDTANVGVQLQAELSSLAGSIPAMTTFGGKPTTDVFGPMTSDALAFAQAIAAGNPQLEQFRQKWLEISINPSAAAGMRQGADLLLSMTANVEKLTQSLTQGRNAVDFFLDGFARAQAAESDMGALAEYSAAINVQLGRMKQVESAALLALNAKTPAQKSTAAEAQAAAQYNTDEDPSVRQLRINQAGALAYAQAVKQEQDQQAQLAKQFDSSLVSAQKETQGIEDQIHTFNMGVEATAEYTMRQKLMDQAQQDHVALTPKVLASIDSIAKAYGDATEQLQKMKDAQEAQQFLAQSLFDAVNGANSLSDAFKKLASSIAQAVEQALLLGTGPLAGIFGTTSSSGGLLGSLFSGILGIGGGSSTGLLGHNANGNAFDVGSNVIPFARGGIVDHPTLFKFASGTGLMGEAGPEAIMPLKRGANGQLGVQMVAANSNSRGSNVSVGVTINSGGGEDPEALATAASALVKKHIKDALTAQDRALPDKVYTIMRNPRRRGTAALPAALTGTGR